MHLVLIHFVSEKEKMEKEEDIISKRTEVKMMLGNRTL